VRCYTQFSGRNSSIIYWTACANWTGHLLPQQYAWDKSGLAVIEVHLPTGYVVMNDYLRDYVTNGSVPNLRYARFRPGRVHLFFKEITQEETCVTFRGDRFYPVANSTIQYLCSVYDYYEPGRYNHSLYELTTLSTQHICNVCGSYQCPYCPYYNAATQAVKHVSLLMALIAAVLIPLLRSGWFSRVGHGWGCSSILDLFY
jgi:CD109 antigen